MAYSPNKPQKRTADLLVIGAAILPVSGLLVIHVQVTRVQANEIYEHAQLRHGESIDCKWE